MAYRAVILVYNAWFCLSPAKQAKIGSGLKETMASDLETPILIPAKPPSASVGHDLKIPTEPHCSQMQISDPKFALFSTSVRWYPAN